MKVCNVCNKAFPFDNFYKGSAKCKPCHIAYSIAWSKANPDSVQKSTKKSNKKRWVKQKQDKEYLSKKHAYRQANREKRIATAKAWNNNNKLKYHEHIRKSHLKRKAIINGGKAYLILEKELKAIYASACSFCGSKNNITIDHIIPLSRGGNHSIGNLQPLCRYCNSSKKTRFISEYRYYLAKVKK